MSSKVSKTDAEWRQQLSDDQYRIARQHGTERAFSGEYWDCKTRGIYHCLCCGEPLFVSDTKYDSGSGWPSFWQPLNNDAVIEKEDNSHSMHRLEILCRKCDAHLGHVFTDGPEPTGLRYCINSASLLLKED